MVWRLPELAAKRGNRFTTTLIFIHTLGEIGKTITTPP